jgi:hypothetical protein
MKPEKTITLEPLGLDSNAFALLGAFQKQARREKWTKEEIDYVMTEAQSGDYNHLLNTLMDYCESPEMSEDESDAE